MSSNQYEDIIDLPHPSSQKRPRMPAMNRAAQFAPFAALTGFEDAVKTTAKAVQEKEGDVKKVQTAKR